MKRTVRSYLKPYRGAIFFALAQLIFISGLELLKPWPLKIVIDNVLGSEPLAWGFALNWSPETLLLSACGGVVLIYLLSGGLTILYNYTSISIGQSMVNDLRADLYGHLQRLSLSFYSRQKVGDLLYRVTADTQAIQTLTMNGFFPILSASGFLAGMFIIMIRLDWQLTLLALIVSPVLFIAVSLLNGRINFAARSASQQESEVYTVVQRAMSAMRVIQAFSKEEEEHRKFMKTSEESMAANLRLYTLQTFYGGTVHVVIAVGTALVLWVGARHVLSGILTPGEMIVFISYLASLYNPISNLVQTYGLIHGAKVGVNRVFEILDVDRDIKDGLRAFPSTGSRGEVIFSRLCFRYLHGKPILQNINLHVEPGKTVAIVGPTGAGKSTLVSFLPRFYDPQIGRVLIDGVDVREFRLKELRQQIAMVLQPALVFPFTVRENIAYGRPEASMDEVVAAARVARIHDAIERLPQRYDTVVGEQGANLSEGEKLRLTIARGILLNAPILILDEPTSSVDAETEELIMEGLHQLMLGRTTFIIAHRLSTVRQADLIVVLREGQIVEQGTFGELIRWHGPFASLYRTQFGLYEEARNLRLVK